MAFGQKTPLQTLARELVLFAAIAAVQAYFMCPRCNSLGDYLTVVAFTFLIWFLLWKGNEFHSRLLSNRISWIEFPVRRFLIGIVATIAYTIAAMFLLMTVFESFFGFGFGEGYMITIYISIAVTILISLFVHGRQFLLYWRQATIEKERLEKENIAAKYESLKNQVNPHFLFNSLNALTNLVYDDPDRAVKFIKQLSEVYRYVLDTRDREIVSLQEELKFLDSFLYLQKIRFGDKLQISVNVRSEGFVAPLALQMLVENCIKHNVISDDDPLAIRIFEDDGFVCVENNLYRKKIATEISAGVGLDNIKKRYQLLTPKPVVIGDDGKVFIVKLPLLSGIAL